MLWLLLLSRLLHVAIHTSVGPYGYAVWIQPARVAAGYAVTLGHVSTWLQFR